VLERYVSKNVAKSILEDKRSFLESLSGRKQSLTVMFSDIRGFTSMTEGADPEHLVKQLNEYFMEMVGIVLAERGTLQKFIGDAIMAAWGDVHSEGAEEDARRAVRTTLRMRDALAKLDKQWASQANRAALHIGMGVNHGEMIVGNIGHPQRMEFTVLGDGVNLAARLETATKQFHTDLLVGESVEALTRRHFIFRRVGLVTFKGKTKPVDTFNVLGERPETDPPWLGRYHEAIGLFHHRQFEAAAALFKAVAAEIGQPDSLCELYLKECATFANVPPPADWNGSFVLSEK
jgi:adenylate cyclase